MTHTNPGEIPERQLRQAAVKCRFFAQYLFTSGTLYVTNPHGGGTFCRILLNTLSQIDEKSYLELKPLSKITDEDALVVAKIWYRFPKEKQSISHGKDVVIAIQDYSLNISNFNSQIKIVDYLRSKGYALPFMEYSVKQLVSFGWIRLP